MSQELILAPGFGEPPEFSVERLMLDAGRWLISFRQTKARGIPVRS
jgi:hypothetical protein